jgi:hypothetical protein
MLRSRSGPIVREVARCDLPIIETNKLLLVFEWRPAWGTAAEDRLSYRWHVAHFMLVVKGLAHVPMRGPAHSRSMIVSV